MRPIVKVEPGETVTYMDSQGLPITHIVQVEYPNYGDAKLPLIGNVGGYCSYCESCREVDSLDIEHLAAKSHGGSETAWENFLLCCKVCNSVKGATVVDENYHWPHLNNTFLSFIYDETGRVKVNPNIPNISQVKAQNLLNLIHLERHGGNLHDIPSPKDYRWRRRYETWNKAIRQKELYIGGKINEDDVIDCAKSNGYWSIWFTVFKGVDAILRRLITDFPGTCASCFDENDHYKPLARRPGLEDPI